MAPSYSEIRQKAKKMGALIAAPLVLATIILNSHYLIFFDELIKLMHNNKFLLMVLPYIYVPLNILFIGYVLLHLIQFLVYQILKIYYKKKYPGEKF